jgi:hypothetical protein
MKVLTKAILAMLLAFMPITTAQANATPSEKIAKLFTPAMLRADIAFIDRNFGPPVSIFGDERQYDVDGCDVVISAEKSVISMELAVSPTCTFDLAPFVLAERPLPVHELTFGGFEAEAGDSGEYKADCLLSCGNAYDPSVYLDYEGPRATDFIKVRLGVKLVDDPAIQAAQAWSDIMVKEQGEAWVMDLKFNDDSRYDEIARKLFRNVKISTVRLQ